MISSQAEIKRRLASVKQTRRIMSAMETVSIAKMRKAIEKCDKFRAYTELLNKVIAQVDIKSRSHAENGKTAVAVLSSDRGLCGGFDHDIFDLADKFCDENTLIIPVGAVAGERYKGDSRADFSFVDSYVANTQTAERLSKALFGLYDNGYGRIDIVYSELVSHATWKAVRKKLLPAERPAGVAEASSARIFSPSEAEITEKIVPMYMTAAVYGALINNIAAEHSARRAAMSAASDSAQQLIEELSVKYNRARQSGITEQIIEIIGATEALENQGVGNEKRS